MHILSSFIGFFNFVKRLRTFGKALYKFIYYYYYYY